LKTLSHAFFFFALSTLSLAAKDISKPSVELLLSGGETILGQEITYPVGKAQLTTLIVTLQPEAKTGWHHHEVPLIGYVLEGDLTVDYGEQGTRVYRAGEAVYEAINISHNGQNLGNVPVRMLVVIAGAKGARNSVPDQ
jgi:quercetin dioxygenase-like cupin family protein